MQIRNLCKFEPAGQTAYCIGFLAMQLKLTLILQTGLLYCTFSANSKQKVVVDGIEDDVR
jgi:hypothetical protein